MSISVSHSLESRMESMVENVWSTGHRFEYVLEFEKVLIILFEGGHVLVSFKKVG